MYFGEKFQFENVEKKNFAIKMKLFRCIDNCRRYLWWIALMKINPKLLLLYYAIVDYDSV